MHTCVECGKKFDSQKGLKVHMSQKHSGKDIDEEIVTKEASAGNITFRLNIRQALSLVFVAGLMAGSLFTMMGFQAGVLNGPTGAVAVADDTNNPSGNNAANDDGGDTDTVDMSDITLEDQPVMGDADAPVTMVLFEDFECPFCKRFEENTMPQVVDNYVESGQVKVVWKDLPLDRLHPWATPAATAMECVYRQDNDAFWAVKDKIFTNQETMSEDNAQDRIKQWAADEGVSQDAVQSCLDNGNPGDVVQADKQDAQSLGASGTPTAFVNGKKIVGAQPYSVVEQAIENALNN